MATPISSSANTLRVTRTFQASREKVFRAWAQPEAMKKWFAPSDDYTTPVAELDLRVGGRYRGAMRSPQGRISVATGLYREVRAPERLVFTWSWEDKPEVGETLVTVELHDRGGATELVLTHELFPNEAARDEHEKGWSGCLSRLVNAL